MHFSFYNDGASSTTVGLGTVPQDWKSQA